MPGDSCRWEIRLRDRAVLTNDTTNRLQHFRRRGLAVLKRLGASPFGAKLMDRRQRVSRDDFAALFATVGESLPLSATLTPSGTKRGFFTRQDFIYDAEHDHYTCPAGPKLTKANRRADHTEDFGFYRHLSACFTCPLRYRCTPAELRRIKRWENEDVLDRMQARLDRMPEVLIVRRQTVEHPFETLKAWMGATYFLTRTLDKVRTEISLHVLPTTSSE